ncbi:ATP-grasp domain-containing protein [Sporomusa malonica]|uniref:Carbamoyl-phosphate synthase large subunit n=1 Tax=Sporomusa malonica TaxID=112901 RepID=A0A1W2EH17_9FIRM|nr:ATP-grasp domain-containing protein [Sporomusa malonica]SMD08636.1 carbamoyl-phosphate synthase large subunit [Sporomusa malonica]
MKKVNVLISGSGSLYGVAIIQSLLKSDLLLKLVACDVSARTLGLYLAHQAYIVPPAHQEELYLASLLNIIAKESIHAIFVASSHELAFYSRNKLDIEKKTGAKVFTNFPETLNLCNDKWLTVNFLKENNFYFPLTIRYPEDQEQVDEFVKDVQFPIVIKPRSGAGSQGLYIVNQYEDLHPLLENKKDIILQQYLPDNCGEFTTGICTGANGKILSGITLKRYLKEGMTMSADSGDFTEITDYCKRVAQVLKPYGPSNFQLRLLNGKPYIFEINPRFSSSTGMRSLLGVNEAEILIRAEILGETISQNNFLKCSVIRQYTDYLVPTEKIVMLQEKFNMEHEK